MNVSFGNGFFGNYYNKKTSTKKAETIEIKAEPVKFQDGDDLWLRKSKPPKK